MAGDSPVWRHILKAVPLRLCLSNDGARVVLIWWVQGTGVRHPCNDLEGALWMVGAVRAWDPEASVCCAYAALASNDDEDFSNE